MRLSFDVEATEQSRLPDQRTPHKFDHPVRLANVGANRRQRLGPQRHKLQGR